MSSRQIAQALFLAAGICILALLIMPAVHLPCVVVHGPTTALRAQRWALLLVLALRAAAFLFAGLSLISMLGQAIVTQNLFPLPLEIGPSSGRALRC